MADEENVDFERTLQWARFVDDPKILKYDDREQLKEYLENLLHGLDGRYITNKDQQFPSSFELKRLTKVVTLLARVLGVRKSGFGDLFSSMKRIENRWSKMQLVAFADGLLKKLCNVPASPRAIVYEAIEKLGKSDHARKELLNQVYSFLDSTITAVKFNEPWEKWYASVQKLEFPSSFMSSCGTSNGLRESFITASGNHGRLLAFLFFMDLRRMQVEWNIKYAKLTQASLKWIYLLQRPDDFRRLKQVYYGAALPPDIIKKGLNTLANRKRRRRSYHKTKRR